jgi:transglutaminase-like putative cysteine protease
MAILTVDHVTRYHYRRRLSFGEHQILFRPRDSFDQRLLDCDLKIQPEPSRVRWVHDVFGNCVTLVEFDGVFDELAFTTRIRLDHTPESAPDFQIDEYAKQHPFAYRADEKPDLQPYINQEFDDVAALDDWLEGFLGAPSPMPTGQLLMTLNEAIAQGFSYFRRLERGTQIPAVTLSSKRGTCRDFALLMMEAARRLGFAARFVTGYIYVPDRDGPQLLGGGSTHAWCQIYLPGSGWVEFDPTNGIVGNRDLIRVAVTRTPDQAVPLFGTFFGQPDDELGMEVSVNVKRAD